MEEVISFVLHRIHDIVENGTYGEHYTIMDREKNKALRRKYYVTDSKVRDILRHLEKTDFIESRKSNHEWFPEDTVYIFCESVKLRPRFVEEAEEEIVKLYIKIVLADDAPMFVISLHEAEY